MVVTSSPVTRVFVYGSLLKGLCNHYHLGGSRLVTAKARTAASTYVLIDSGEGYPYAIAGALARDGD